MPIIINGASRRAGGWWAKHLENKATNERAEVVEIVGLNATTVPDAFREMYALSRGTKCDNYFYQANINPRADEHLTPEQWRKAVDTLERNLGLTGQPRFVIEHEKEGRTHRHVVWSRTDTERMVAISDSLTAAIHERTSRELEITLDLERGRSILVPDREFDRPERRPKKHETIRALDGGLDPQTVKAEVIALRQSADNAHSFKAALESSGYVLARGDGRDFVIIDRAVDDHSLARRAGMKAAELREWMKEIDPASLPSVAEARAQQRARLEAERASNWDRDAANAAWMEQINAAAIAKAEAAHAQEGRQQSEPAGGVGKDQPAARGRYAGLQPEEAAPEPAPGTAEHPLGKTAGEIRTAWNLSRDADPARDAEQLHEALASHGITLARTSATEAAASQEQAALYTQRKREQEQASAAAARGRYAEIKPPMQEPLRYAPRLAEGEIVAVDGRGGVYRLDERTTGQMRPDIEARLAGIEPDGLLNVTDAKEATRDASRETWRDARRHWQDTQRPLTGIETRIAEALSGTMTGIDFAIALDEAGITIARATAADVLALDALRQESDRAATVARTEGVTNTHRNGRSFAYLVEGDFAAITRKGDVFRLNPTALDFGEAEQRLADTQLRLPSVVEARALNETNHEKTADFWAQLRADHTARAMSDFGTRADHQTMRDAAMSAQQAKTGLVETAESAVAQTTRGATRVLGGLARAVETLLGGLFSFFGAAEPKLSPQQAELAGRAAQERAEARAHIVAEQETTAAYDWMRFAQGRQEQQEDLNRSQQFGGPATREASLDPHANVRREQERDREYERD